MKLVNARGMDEGLYQLKDGLEKDLTHLLKNHFLSNCIRQAANNSPEFVLNDNYRVVQQDSVYTIETLQKNSWKKYFSVSDDKINDKDSQLMSKFLQKDINMFDVKNFSGGVPDKKIDTFLEDNYPKWKTIAKTISLGMFCNLLNIDAEMQNYNDSFNKELPLLSKYANLHKGKKNAYNYGSDNSFYVDSKGDIIVTNQNYSYKVKEKNGFYTINAVEPSPREEDPLNVKFTFDTKKEDEFKLQFVNIDQPFVLTHFMLDLQYAIQGYEKEHNIKEEVNPVVKSYAYHLAYMNHNFELTKEQIIWRMAFYCFPGGADENGNYIYDKRDNLPYQKAVEKKMDTIHDTISHSEFTIPVDYKNNNIFKKMKNLNEDWQLYFREAHQLVTEFVEKYENSSTEIKSKLSHDSEEVLLPNLKEFITISERLGQPAKVKKNKLK